MLANLFIFPISDTVLPGITKLSLETIDLNIRFE